MKNGHFVKNTSLFNGSLLFLMSLCTFLVDAAESKKLALHIYTENLPPYNFKNEEKITGINIEATRALCEIADIKCTFELLPWNRAYRNALDNPNSGIVSTSRLVKRETLFKWIGPLASANACFFKLAERQDIIVSKPSDLLNYKIGMAKDLAFKDYLVNLGFIPGQNLILYTRPFGNLRAFKQGRIDLIVGSVNSLPFQLSEGDIDMQALSPVFPVPDSTVNGNFLALNINTTDEIYLALERAIQDFTSSGQLERIRAEFQSDHALLEDKKALNAMQKTCLSY
uniref:substrate-binding periplasmic protein n=1 Tax=Ningiella ruwaisensis TaxID=2364274 RepID=UPI00109F4874|nr:transporter substrate-binding domain-containing protein [Ningiella ruwaisensis]